MLSVFLCQKGKIFFLYLESLELHAREETTEEKEIIKFKPEIQAEAGCAYELGSATITTG